MKEYRYEINGQTYRVRIKEISGCGAAVEVNDQTYQVNMMADPAAAASPSPLRVPAGATAGRSVAAAGPDKPVAPPGSNGAVKAPMPGVVQKLLVREGDAVTAGDTVMVIEAMKMENDIKTPLSGTVRKIMVAPGASVNTGDPVILIAD